MRSAFSPTRHLENPCALDQCEEVLVLVFAMENHTLPKFNADTDTATAPAVCIPCYLVWYLCLISSYSNWLRISRRSLGLGSAGGLSERRVSEVRKRYESNHLMLSHGNSNRCFHATSRNGMNARSYKTSASPVSLPTLPSIHSSAQYLNLWLQPYTDFQFRSRTCYASMPVSINYADVRMTAVAINPAGVSTYVMEVALLKNIGANTVVVANENIGFIDERRIFLVGRLRAREKGNYEFRALELTRCRDVNLLVPDAWVSLARREGLVARMLRGLGFERPHLGPSIWKTVTIVTMSDLRSDGSGHGEGARDATAGGGVGCVSNAGQVEADSETTSVLDIKTNDKTVRFCNIIDTA